MTNAVKLSNLIRDNKIVHVVQGKQYINNKEIVVSDIYRPGLELTGYFDFYPRQRIHGVLVEVKGMGVLLTGDSGVGKSETALGLIHRGHRLIADDRVDVYQKDVETVMGEAPEILKHLMEIRGIGIIDVMDLFGVGAVKNRESIQLVIKLVNWDKKANYDRLGFEESKRDICNVEVPQITIPVKVGRNMEDIIEIATMNFRAKRSGYNATKTFDSNLTKLIKKNSQADTAKDKNK